MNPTKHALDVGACYNSLQRHLDGLLRNGEMNSLSMNPDVFILRHDPHYILYLPLKSIVALVNSDTVKLLNAIEDGRPIDVENEVVQQLLRLGVFDQFRAPFKETPYKPTQVTFLPSFACNLRCLYCYSDGGDCATAQISSEAARSAVDFIVLNAQETGRKTIQVSFHGGGEPMLMRNKGFIETVIDYAKAKARDGGLRFHASAVTNGIDVSLFGVDWLKEHFSRFNISLDGPPDIQNYQRPRRGPNPNSYNFVLDTIHLFEAHEIDYEIRSTITRFSVSRMDEIVRHFASVSSKKVFHLEPLFECGRCKTSKLEAPSQSEFLENYIKAYNAASDLGLKVHYSGAAIERVADRFCGAAGDNFFITPDGIVTTCIEACRDNDLDNIPFFIGHYDHDHRRYEFDETKIQLLKKRVVSNLPSCTGCFNKYNCGGDCLVKGMKVNGTLFDTSHNYRCDTNIGIMNFLIAKRAQ